MMPATPVPWPSRSWVGGPGTNDVPESTAPFRWALPGSTPESTTATVTPLPVASDHDCGTPRLLMAYDDWLTYCVRPTSQSVPAALEVTAAAVTEGTVSVMPPRPPRTAVAARSVRGRRLTAGSRPAGPPPAG